jgi:recombinational DNA repair ATPase RecF
MTPDHYIEKAKHAMLTGQPNLAMLYMKRGMVILDQRRRAHLMKTWDGQLILFGEAMNELGRVFVESFTPAVRAANVAVESFHRQLLEAFDQELTQMEFALVSE